MLLLEHFTVGDKISAAVAKDMYGFTWSLVDVRYNFISVMPEVLCFLVVWKASDMALGVLWASWLMISVSTIV